MLLNIFSRPASRFAPPPAMIQAAITEIDDCPIPKAVIGPAELKVGVWPDDPDEVPAWRLAQEARAIAVGRQLPPYRTKREFEAHVALAVSKIELDASPVLAPALPPAEAVREFIDMLLRCDRTGEYSAAEIYAAYLDHCTATRRTSIGEKSFRMSLDGVPGLTSQQLNIMNSHGRRHRPKIYTVHQEGDAIDHRNAA